MDGWQDGSTARLVHSIDVTFDDSDLTSTPGPDVPGQLGPDMHFTTSGRQLEEANSGVPDTRQRDNGPPIVNANPLCQLPQPRVVIEPMPPTYVAQPAQPEYCTPADAPQEFFYKESSPQPRPRFQGYSAHVSDLQYQNRSILQNLVMLTAEQADAPDRCIDTFQSSNPSHSTYYGACFTLAAHATNEMDLKTALVSEDADKAINCCVGDGDVFSSFSYLDLN